MGALMLIILDRDGVINEESHLYIKNPNEWIPIPGSLAAITKLNKAGHHVVVASNQSGIGRGLYDHHMLQQIHDKMQNALAKVGGHIDAIFYCPHSPDENCSCRKPKPGLFLQIAEKFHTDFSNAIAIGDSLRDLQAAQAVNCRAILVRTGNGEKTLAQGVGLEGVSVFSDLADFVSVFLQK